MVESFKRTARAVYARLATALVFVTLSGVAVTHAYQSAPEGSSFVDKLLSPDVIWITVLLVFNAGMTFRDVKDLKRRMSVMESYILRHPGRRIVSVDDSNERIG